MKYLLIPIAVLLLNCSGSKTNTGEPETIGWNKFELPKTWDKNFNITLYEGGGMAYESTNIFLFADSCKYVRMENGVDSIKRFTLTATEKEQILAKLASFNIDKIKTVDLEGTVYDKETTRMCFSKAVEQAHCIETGATQRIKEINEGDFYNAYMYLVDLAKQKK